MKLSWMREDAPLRVDWPVLFEAPADGGGLDAQEVEVRFEIIPAAEAEALLMPEPGQLARAITGGVDPDTSVRFLRRVVTGWDAAAVGLPFGAEALDRLLRFPFSRNALFKAYSAAAQGRKAKN